MSQAGRPKFDAWIRRNWWCLLCPVMSLGWLTWLGFVYAGARARKWTWFAAGVLYGVGSGVSMALLTAAPDPRSATHSAAFDITLGMMGGGLMHGLAIRGRYEARRAEISDQALEAAERRRSAQTLARRLVRDDPTKARQLGVGRPDLPGSFDAGLVDLNSAPAEVIARTCGVEPDIAGRIVATREDIGGNFSSLEDMDLVLDLPMPVLARLRDAAVFVPR